MSRLRLKIRNQSSPISHHSSFITNHSSVINNQRNSNTGSFTERIMAVVVLPTMNCRIGECP